MDLFQGFVGIENAEITFPGTKWIKKTREGWIYSIACWCIQYLECPVGFVRINGDRINGLYHPNIQYL